MANGQTERLIESFEFTARAHDQRDRFEAWAEEVSPLFDVAPDREVPVFEGAIKAYLLDGVVVGRSRFSAQKYERDRALVARSGLDAYLVQLYTIGGFGGRAGERDMSVRAGDVCVFDLTATLSTRAEESTVVNVILPKLAVDRHWNAAALDANGLVIPRETVLGRLMAAHLSTLYDAMPGVTLAEAPAVADATARLVAGCLAHCAGDAGSAARPMRDALFRRAMQHIRAHLSSPDLSPASLCAALNVSRPHLYRAFREVGGVERAIFHQRLMAAFRQLSDPANRSDTIGEVAFRCGFASDAHFSRLFRQVFGMRPRDIRDGPPSVPPAGEPGLPSWLSTRTFLSPPAACEMLRQGK